MALLSKVAAKLKQPKPMLFLMALTLLVGFVGAKLSIKHGFVRYARTIETEFARIQALRPV